MNRQALSHLVIGGILILLLSLGCSIFSSLAPTATPAPTLTATRIPTSTLIPTSTPIPTETPVPGPRPGSWSGPGASFTITEYGQVQDFKLAFDYGDSTCTYTSSGNIPIVDDAFAIHVTTNSQNFIDLFDSDEAMYITGAFDGGTDLTGTWGALMCGEQISFSINADGKFGPVTGEWTASWQGPLADSGSDSVSATATPRTVTLHFTVTVPATTDGTDRSVYFAGTLDQLHGGLPVWDPGGVVMTRQDATHWTITLTGDEGVQIEYKYALGSWDYVEKDGVCGEIENRQLTLSYGADGNMTVNDTVQNWRNVAPCGNE